MWVFAEQKDNSVLQVVLELLGGGRKLADTLSVPLSAVLLGSKIEDHANTLFAYGADRVYLVEDESLENYNDESYADIFHTAC